MNSNYLIILLNYNNWQDTVECIQSLKKCNVNDSNILIIENCSHNNSVDKLKELVPGVKIIQNEKTKKNDITNYKTYFYKISIYKSKGEELSLYESSSLIENNFDYTIVLNNDTIVESKESIKNLIEEMDGNSDVTLGTGRIFYYPDKNKIW